MFFKIKIRKNLLFGYLNLALTVLGKVNTRISRSCYFSNGKTSFGKSRDSLKIIIFEFTTPNYGLTSSFRKFHGNKIFVYKKIVILKEGIGVWLDYLMAQYERGEAHQKTMERIARLVYRTERVKSAPLRSTIDLKSYYASSREATEWPGEEIESIDCDGITLQRSRFSSHTHINIKRAWAASLARLVASASSLQTKHALEPERKWDSQTCTHLIQNTSIHNIPRLCFFFCFLFYFHLRLYNCKISLSSWLNLLLRYSNKM